MNYYRKRHADKEWTKKVDISILFKIEQATGYLRKLTEKEISDDPLKKKFLTEIEALELSLAVAQGRVENIELKKEVLPEDTPKTKYRRSARPKKTP
jgi:hypothetical protein